MLEFREIQISDKDKITKALKQSDFMGCEYSFANNMAWRRLADTKISFYKNFYISCAFGNEYKIPCFLFPAGNGDYKEVLQQMKLFSDSVGTPLKICGVTKKCLPLFEELFGGQYLLEFDRDSSDYIYNSNDIINLSGRKYHSKRNHLARFKEFDYTFSPITDKDIDDCITFSSVTYNNKSNGDNHSLIAEQYAINTYFTYFNELGLNGGIIRIDGETVAVTVGEPLNSNTYCVHIEKADTSYNGIYAAVNNFFASRFASGFDFINREEDMGLEGLRKAKLSYKPAFILEKYIVTFK